MQRIFKNYNLLFVITLLLLFSYYSFVGIVMIDPDFGWHLRFGQILIKTHSVPRLDLFSYTMPSHSFVNHEWGTDLVFAGLYPIFGQAFLSLIFAFITVFALFLQAKNLPKKWLAFSFFLGGMSIAPFTFVRPQVFSVLFFYILIALLLNKKYFEKWLLFIPFLFLIWANLHGAFFLGLVIFGIYILTKNIESKAQKIKAIIIFLFSILATLINPYGINLWKEAFITATSPALRQYIQEWFPAVFSINLAFFALSIFSIFFLFKYFGKFILTEKILYFVLFFIALSSVKNIVFFVPLGLFITAKGTEFFYKDLSNFPFGKIRFNKLYIVLCFLTLLFFSLKIFWGFYALSANTETGLYPKRAIEFLQKNNSKGQIFSEINWGGYLIWKLPNKKVFIDGRMPSWENPLAPKSESKNAFSEYNQVLNQKIPLTYEINKYKIDTVLINPANKSSNKTSNKLFRFLQIPLLGNQYDVNSFINELQKNGFKLVYKDSVAQIYRKF